MGTCMVERARLMAWCVGVAGAFLIVGWLAWLVAERTRPAGVDLVRADLRRKNLSELQAENLAALSTYAWIDRAKGIVRLPVSRALELSVELAHDPVAARSNLLARLDRATAKLPEKPNQYE